MPENATQRLFFALWPDDGLRDWMGKLVRHHLHNRGRPVRRENLHITLVFLGSVDAPRRACVEAAAAAIRGQPFALELDRLSWWPRPRVVFAAVSRPPSALLELVGELKRACGECGFEPERRPYRAHLTLARKVSRGPPPMELEAQAWDVRDFCLVESRTLSAGAEYSVLRSWPLG